MRMSIHDAKNYIEHLKDKYNNTDWIEASMTLDELRGYEDAKLIVSVYEEAKAELEGATIIPKGWKILNVLQISTGKYKAVVGKHFIVVTGFGDTRHEALRNAIEKIETNDR